MLQKQFSKMLDEIAYAYMSTKKKRGNGNFHDRTLMEYLEINEINDPYEFFANPGKVPEVTIHTVKKRSGYTLTRFDFKSFVETPHTVNNTVHCRLYKINGKATAPTIIVLHGWQMESYTFLDYYCRFVVREGFNAVLMNLPYHMSRRAPKSHHGEFTFSDDTVLTIKVMKQCIWDVQGIINWLKGQGVQKIGTFGVSYGGMIAGLTGCVDSSVDFMMLVVPPANLYEFFTDTRLGHEFAKRNPGMYKEVKANREVFEMISIDNLKPKMPPEKIFIVKAEYDLMLNPEALDRLWRNWGQPHFKSYKQGHLSVLLFNPSMPHHTRRWLKLHCRV